MMDLRLSENRFSGTIPADFAQFVRLEILHMSHNEFTGSIPPSIFSQTTRLMELNFANNTLTGQLPTSLGFLGDLSKPHLLGLHRLFMDSFVADLVFLKLR